MQNLIDRIKSANLKEKTIAIVLILVLTISASTAIMSAVNAQVQPQVNTYSSTPTLGSNGLWNLPTFAGLTVSLVPSVSVRQLSSSWKLNCCHHLLELRQ